MASSTTGASYGIYMNDLAKPTSSKANALHSTQATLVDGDDDIASITDTYDPAFTEHTNVTRRRIGVIQVSSLVVNQMIDSSMLTSPGAVLAITGSKPLGIALWVMVGFYTFLSGFMFVEYSSAFPFTGGPLIWFDEIFSRPAMLAPIIFAWYWTLLATTASVCQNTAINLVALADPARAVSDYPDGFVRLTAAAVVTVVCLALYLARRFCFMLMSIFAAIKVAFFLAIFIGGISIAVKREKSGGLSGLSDFNTHRPSGGGLEQLSALIYVAFTYQGWEHTNYIAGEIQNPRTSLRKGIFCSIILVWILYVLATVAFYAVLTYDEIVTPSGIQGKMVGVLFADQVFGSPKAATAMAALSSFSCALALTYTDAKVRQAIAWQRIVPFYKFTGRQDRQFDSPGGALFVHWVFSIMKIASISRFSSGAEFWGFLYTYGYQIELALLAIGLLWLHKLIPDSINGPGKLQTIRSRWLLYLLIIIMVGFNIMVIVAVAMGNTMSIPNYWMTVAIASMGVAGLLQWGLFRSLSMKRVDGRTWGQKLFGFEVNIHTTGDDESLLSDNFKQLMRDAKADGTRRRVEYKLHGRLKLCRDKLAHWADLFMSWLE